MDYDNFGSLDASIQDKIDTDSDFQATLVELSDEDKETAVKTRKSELLDEEIKTLSSGNKKSKELADNYKVRAEKAERELKDKKPDGEITPKNDDLSSKDTLAFINAKVTEEEDIDEIVDYAKFKKISVAEALKSNVIVSSLAEKAEKRATANATNIGAGRKSSTRISDEEILNKSLKGEIPEPGSLEAEQLFRARTKLRTKK